MSNLTRRGALAGVAANLMILRPETAFGTQANSAVSFGVIGAGGRGIYVGAHMTRDTRARLGAICDLYPDRIDSAKTRLPGADKVQAYKDYRDLLARKDIDAVLIASPVYLHPEHFEAAVQAGKHIFCEKPASADVSGALRVQRASDKADKTKTIAFGFQQRFSPEYLTAENYLRTGKIGEMKLMMSYWILGGTPSTSFKSQYPLEDQKNRHWGRWMETSGGAIVEQDCHGIDVLNWFANHHPLSASGRGGLRYPIPYGDWDSDNHNIVYVYPNGIQGWLISIKHTAGFRDVKEQFYGSLGMLETARTYYKLHGMTPNVAFRHADDLSDRSLMERRESAREITIDAVEAFFASIVGNKPYNMAKDAVEATLAALLGRLAYQSRREVSWEELLRTA